MSDIQDIPVNFLLRPEFNTMLAAAKVDGKCNNKKPFDYLTAIYKDDRYTTELQRLSTVGQLSGGVAAGYVVGSLVGPLLSTALGGPIGLIGAIVMLIDGGRSMNVIVINDTDTDISLTDSHDETGEQVARPIAAKVADRIPRRLPAIPDPADASKFMNEAAVWYGCYSFRKATTLGIGFLGTSGAMSYTAQDASILPSGFSFGWDVPEKGHNNCAVSVNSKDASAFYTSWIDGDTKRSTDSSGNSTSNVKTYCAMESQKDNPNDANLVIVITDGKLW